MDGQMFAIVGGMLIGFLIGAVWGMRHPHDGHSNRWRPGR